MTAIVKSGSEWHNADLDGPHSEQEGEIAALADGGYVVVWIDSNDGYTAAVRAQRFDSFGTPVGAEIIVDQGPGNVPYSAKSNVAVSGLADGHFVVAWDQNYAGFNGNGVLARTFDSTGQALGGTFPVATYSDSFPSSESPRILPAADGSFWIVSEDFVVGRGQGLIAQHLDQTGANLGPGIELLNLSEATDVSFPEVAQLADGRVVVGWSETIVAPINEASFKLQIYDRDFKNGGAVVTIDHSTEFGATFWHDGIVALPDGGFAVEWLAWRQNGESSIYVQTFNAAGAARNSPTLVTTHSSGQLSNADIALNGAGELVVSWIAPDGSSIMGQKIAADGAPLGTSFEISPADIQRNVHLVGLSGGGYVSQFIGNSEDGWAVSAQAFNLSIISGSSGNDKLNGTAFDDVLNGLAGSDVLNGLAGNDRLNGGAGNDTLDGGVGSDTAVYDDAAGAVKVSLLLTGLQNTGSAAGVDKLVSIENLVGSAFADTLTGNDANNRMEGMDGNDKIDGKAGADLMVGGKGNDTYTVDTLYDVVAEKADEGTDTVNVGFSYILGENVEKLVLTGGDSLEGTGNALANSLTGNAGANHLYGLDGNDTLDGKGGADALFGGMGNDTYVVDDPGDVVSESAGAGTDTVKASIAFILADNLEKLTLTGAGDLDGTGNALANTVIGNAGANHLWGLAGKDIISGGLGTDSLWGGLGADNLTGGGDADLFGFDTLESSASKDTIKDFEHGIDEIALSRSVFTAFSGSAPGGISANAFALGTAAAAATQHLIYNQATGALYYDADGVGGQSQVQIALLSTRPVLDAADFVLI
ncbi:calcium-binding protein [Novosphingobium cyanobacteriorum]|uniref:Calcium-binding protein n=1 Tax=Novosphingobium cyanobacteriorum TaxID=3024215 RepID=A0ABT6CKT0_9SPHN|nr:calcium-binding protein [Novosphingobium cyanobacteriorum]MDF8333675.1 calcium-binding protein [Novosphingobium cyanobacteriorum]